MEQIHLLTDSSADIPRPLVEQYGIEVVPITLAHEGRILREYYDITPQEYWKLLRDSATIPHTALVPPGRFYESFAAARARGDTHVLGIFINGEGSGTYRSALTAREQFYQEAGREMRIALIDSETYTYIYGHVVVLAARMRAGGESFDAMEAVARSRLKRCEAMLGVYSLRHLKKSGRISGGAAFLGEAMGVRPLSLVRAGAVTVAGKVRGDKNVAAGIAAAVKRRAVNPAAQTAGLLYGDVDEEKIAALEQALLSECGFAAVERWPIGPSVITNTGPEALAAFYYGAPREEAAPVPAAVADDT